MKISQIVFSPTGGTRRAADILTEAMGGEASLIDLSRRDLSACELSSDDLAVIAVPSYGGRVPALAVERLSNVKGNGAGCVLVCVYGNRAYEDTLIELKDAAEKCGFNVIAAVAAVAEHSIARQYAAGRPDALDAKALQGFAAKILEKLNSGEKGDVKVPGDRPYKKAGGSGMVPKAGKECVVCGLCAKVCPAGAISAEDPKITDGDKCISCMRCVAECPHSARRLNAAMAAAVSLALKAVCSERKDCELFI